MPAQRTRTPVPAAARSAFSQFPGVPAWGAVLIAVTATLIGFAIEAGSGREDLGTAFAVSYLLGCVAAALAVRASGIFTAVIQPPLLLFVAVPLSYFLLNRSSASGLKDLLITCGYPLVERFPLMLFTAAAVLLVGLVRWYSTLGAADTPVESDAGSGAESGAGSRPGAPAGPGLVAGLMARLSALARPTAGSATATAGRPRHGIDRTARRAPRSDRHRGERPERPTGSRPRHARAEEGGRSRPAARGTAREAGTPPQHPRPRPHREQYEPRPERAGGRRQFYGYPDGAPPDYPNRRGERGYRDAGHRGAQSAPRDGHRGEYWGYGEPGPAYPPRQQPPYPPRHRPRGEASAAPRGEPTHHPVSRVRYRGEPAAPVDRDRPGRTSRPGRDDRRGR